MYFFGQAYWVPDNASPGTGRTTVYSGAGEVLHPSQSPESPNSSDRRFIYWFATGYSRLLGAFMYALLDDTFIFIGPHIGPTVHTLSAWNKTPLVLTMYDLPT